MKRKKQNKRIIITGGVVVFFFISLLLFYFLFKNDEELVEKESEVVIKTNVPEKEEEKEEEPLIDAEAVLSVYYNDGNKKVLYSKNEDEVLPIASISKLMTALIVFENYNLDEEVDVLGVSSFKGWRETKIKSVVSQMIVESNNVSAFVLAIISDRFLKKDEEKIDSFQLFVKEMNKKAEKIGLENTFFINPSGLDDGSNYNKSTATELAELSNYILENQKEIFDISKIPTYYTYSPDGTIYYKSFNTNFLVYNSEENWQEEMIGGKTGTTNMAGQCLLIVFKKPEGEGYIINVILGSQDRFEDMNKLINYARSNS
ncbi:MAG: hypothetical protein K9M12_00770 [Candidatus Pacebacteria bacterium]|nr:hypothetical protein [Candidatus Paceibacterota bacterium]